MLIPFATCVGLVSAPGGCGSEMPPAAPNHPAVNGTPPGGEGTGGTDVPDDSDAGSSEFALIIGISGSGTTIPSAGRSLHPADTVVTLTARPGEGFRFHQWSGDVFSDHASMSIAMDRDRFLTAEFVSLSADVTPRVYLPWARGVTRKVSQGNNSNPTHQGQFAWDFPMAVGTPVLACEAGRVAEVLESSRTDADGEPIRGQPANFVRIGHGRGLVSFYAHLNHLGAAVVPGQLVARGQLIGYSGNTGLSTAPHLHFEVFNTLDESISARFFEVNRADGIPIEGDYVRSGNELAVESADAYVPSRVPDDAFGMNNVELTGSLPPALFLQNETDYKITGRVLDDHSIVCAALVEPESGVTLLCDLTETASDKTFVIDWRIPAELSGRYHWGVISGPRGAFGVAPLSALVMPPADGRDRPRALIDPPRRSTVAFFDTRPLIGEGSYSPVGRPLTFQWSQVSGPPADIADPGAANTEFTIPPGEGDERLSFQLVTYDGHNYSLATQVDFTMPDTFLVERIGISATPCQSAETCPVYDPPPPVVPFVTEQILGWVQVVGLRPGDILSFVITNPDGLVVRTNEVTVLSDPGEHSFWRFASTSSGLEPLPGIWTGSFLHNGRLEATVDFRVEP